MYDLVAHCLVLVGLFSLYGPLWLCKRLYGPLEYLYGLKWSCLVLHGHIFSYMVLYHIVLYSPAWSCIIQSSIVLYDNGWSCIVFMLLYNLARFFLVFSMALRVLKNLFDLFRYA